MIAQTQYYAPDYSRLLPIDGRSFMLLGFLADSMRVCVIGSGRAVMKDVPIPVPDRREVLISMKACGICGTDLEKLAGNYPSTILGHEAVGVIESVGQDVSDASPGDRVFPHHHVPCYECHFCRNGSETMCPHFSKSNIHPGGLSEFFILPEWNISHGGLFKLPDRISFRRGTLIEPLACVLRGQRMLGLNESSTVAVVGVGPVGMLHIYALRSMGVKNIMAMDPSSDRCEFAAKLGANASFTSAGEMRESVLSASDGRGADSAIIATGHPAATEAGISSIRKGGKLLQFGLPHPKTTLIHDTSDLFRREIQLLTSYSGVEKDVQLAIEMLATGDSIADEIISHSYPLENAPDAFVLAEDVNAARKIIIENATG